MDSKSLYIDSVQHAYNGRQVLAGVYLQSRPGKVIGILGRNGCGKTTLLKIIFGSINADFKFLRINDVPTKTGFLSREVVYVPQQNFIPGNLTVKAALELFTHNFRQLLLDEPFISDNLHNRMRDLSGGNRRLAESLIMIYSDATFVLLDEPFSQLGPLPIDLLKAHIDRMKEVKGFILTDHYYDHILSCSSEIMLLHNGCNYAIADKAALRKYGYLPGD